MYVCMYVSMYVWMFVCVYMRERQRTRDRDTERKREKEKESIQRYLLFVVLDAQDAVFGRFWFPNDSHDVVFQFP